MKWRCLRKSFLVFHVGSVRFPLDGCGTDCRAGVPGVPSRSQVNQLKKIIPCDHGIRGFFFVAGKRWMVRNCSSAQACIGRNVYDWGRGNPPASILSHHEVCSVVWKLGSGKNLKTRNHGVWVFVIVSHVAHASGPPSPIPYPLSHPRSSCNSPPNPIVPTHATPARRVQSSTVVSSTPVKVDTRHRPFPLPPPCPLGPHTDRPHVGRTEPFM